MKNRLDFGIELVYATIAPQEQRDPAVKRVD